MHWLVNVKTEAILTIHKDNYNLIITYSYINQHPAESVAFPSILINNKLLNLFFSKYF